MRLIKLLFSALLLLTIQMANAQDAQTFEEGKDYLPIAVMGTDTVGNINVVEFFNYGCPACNLSEPSIDKWLKTKPASVSFERIPVLFHPEWINYTKAFYVAKALGVQAKISPAIFDAIHKQKQDLTNEKDLAKFFAQQGVSEADFESIFNFSPGMVAQTNRANSLMIAYLINPTLIAKYNWIPEIPAFIVNGKYLVSLSLAKGDSNRMMQIVDYLLKKK